MEKTKSFLLIALFCLLGTAGVMAQSPGVDPPQITAHPSTVGQTQFLNGVFTGISVTATGNGAETLAYQWYSSTQQSRTSGTRTLIAGATANAYTPLATTMGTLYYYCKVTGEGGTVSSSVSGAFLVNPPTTKQLTVKVYLQGLWNGTGMNKCKKYDDALGDFVDAFATDVVDTISIELRNKTTYATIDYQLHGLELHQDGTVTSAGKIYIEVPSAVADDYRITVRTRNHLETTSAIIVSFSGSAIDYNFTDAVTKAYESDPSFAPMVQKDGKWMLYAGNPLPMSPPQVNTDAFETTDLFDVVNRTSDFTGIFGYLTNDINGDGIVDTSDIFDFTLPNFNAGIYFYFPE